MSVQWLRPTPSRSWVSINAEFPYTAQAHGMRHNDPNYIPGAPDNLTARPPKTNTPAAVAMEALPTGLAGGVKYGDTSGPKASGTRLSKLHDDGFIVPS